MNTLQRFSAVDRQGASQRIVSAELRRVVKIEQLRGYGSVIVTLALMLTDSTIVKNPEALTRKKALHDEMAALSKQQSEALRVAIFLPFTRQQAAEYDTRQIRIGEICKQLGRS